eukprot:13963737-Alexandrium_andersonii.AAC.1
MCSRASARPVQFGTVSRCTPGGPSAAAQTTLLLPSEQPPRECHAVAPLARCRLHVGGAERRQSTREEQG